MMKTHFFPWIVVLIVRVLSACTEGAEFCRNFSPKVDQQKTELLLSIKLDFYCFEYLAIFPKPFKCIILGAVKIITYGRSFQWRHLINLFSVELMCLTHCSLAVINPTNLNCLMSECDILYPLKLWYIYCYQKCYAFVFPRKNNR